MLPRTSGLLILLTVLSAGSAGRLCPAQQAQLGAPVRYHFGDDASWADSNFDDSAWPVAQQGRWPAPPFSSDGFVWVRYRIPVRSDASGPLAVRSSRNFFARGLSVRLADELYVDGVLAGRQGRLPPHVHFDIYQRDAVFDLPATAAAPGKIAVVALRVWCPPYLRVPAFSGAFQVYIDESRNLLLAKRADHLADLYANGLDLALDIGIAILGIGMLVAWRWTGERNLLVFAWVMIPQAILLLMWNPTMPGAGRLPFHVGIVASFAALTLFMLALVELNWTVHRLRAPLLKRLCQAAAVVFTLSILIPGLPVSTAPLIMLAALPADLIFEFLLVAVNVWAILVRRTNPLLVLTLLGNPAIALLEHAGIVPDRVMVGPFYEHTIALADFVIDFAIFILLSHGAWKAWRARDELRVEFDAAREVQEQLVAPATDVPGFKIESVYAPAKQVGGDFFRVLPEADGSVLVVVGDVSGKGLKAAMTVSTIMGALRDYPSRRPTDVLAHLSEGGPVEVDEAYVGGHPKNKHLGKRDNQIGKKYLRNLDGSINGPNPDYKPHSITGRATRKTPVFGMLDREARQVRAHVIPQVKREVLMNAILANIEKGSTIYSDGLADYKPLRNMEFMHDTVNHVTEYVRGNVHTQGIENFWSLLKRSLRGTYVAVEPFHLDSYVTEQVFRFNNRSTKDNPLTDADRFMLAVSQISGKRLTYAELTGKVGETTV